MSLVCQDCDKQLRGVAEAELHATKTGHQNFAESTEEIKPLTEEEKAAKVKLLEARMKEKKAARLEQEKKDAIEREKERRKAGQKITEAQAKFEMDQMKRLAEQTRREKAAAKKHRQKVLADVAKDKADRAAKKQQTHKSGDSAVAAAPVVAAAAASPKPAQPAADTARIQIRAGGGKTLKSSFPATANLSELFSFIRTSLPEVASISLQSNYPKKTFTESDSALTFRDAGLVPSCALILR